MPGWHLNFPSERSLAGFIREDAVGQLRRFKLATGAVYPNDINGMAAGKRLYALFGLGDQRAKYDDVVAGLLSKRILLRPGQDLSRCLPIRQRQPSAEILDTVGSEPVQTECQEPGQTQPDLDGLAAHR